MGPWRYGMFGPIMTMAVAAVIIYFVARALFRTPSGNRDSCDSLNILKRRLAEGEITVDEFNTLKKHL